MLGKLLKNKKSKGEQKKLPFDKEEKKEKKKKPGAAGPSWVAAAILGVSILLGVFFWVYGNMDKLRTGELTKREKVSREVPYNEEGLIIFEKE